MKHAERIIPVVAAGLVAGCSSHENSSDLQFTIPPPAEVVAIDCYNKSGFAQGHEDNNFTAESKEEVVTLAMVDKVDKSKLVAGVAIQGLGALEYRFATSDNSVFTLNLDEGVHSFGIAGDNKYNLMIAAGPNARKDIAQFAISCIDKTAVNL